MFSFFKFLFGSKEKKIIHSSKILSAEEVLEQSNNSTAQHSTAQHSTAQHSTAQHSTAQHSKMILMK